MVDADRLKSSFDKLPVAVLKLELGLRWPGRTPG
jgi:hypothetical protein